MHDRAFGILERVNLSATITGHVAKTSAYLSLFKLLAIREHD
jgi:hypothetical protein